MASNEQEAKAKGKVFLWLNWRELPNQVGTGYRVYYYMMPLAAMCISLLISSRQRPHIFMLQTHFRMLTRLSTCILNISQNVVGTILLSYEVQFHLLLFRLHLPHVLVALQSSFEDASTVPLHCHFLNLLIDLGLFLFRLHNWYFFLWWSHLQKGIDVSPYKTLILLYKCRIKIISPVTDLLRLVDHLLIRFFNIFKCPSLSISHF